MLSTKEKILDAILNNSLDLISFHDMAGVFEHVSPSIKEITGWEAEDVLGKNAYDYFHPDDIERIQRESHEEVKQGRKNNIIEYRFRCKGGGYKWMQALSQPIIGDSGKPERILSVTRDVDGFLKLQESLQINEALAKETNHLAKVGGWEVDIVNNTVWWSDVVKEIHEVSPDFVPNLEEGINFYVPEHKEIINEVVEKAIKTGKGWDVELDIITAKGNRRAVRALGKVELKDGKPIKLYGAFQDISEVKEKAESLRLSEERFRGSFENSAVGKALVSLEGKMTKVNPAWCNMLGYTEEELTQLSFQDFTHPDDLSEDLKHVQELIAGKADTYQMEKRYFTKAKEIVWVILSVSIVRDLEDTPLFFISEVQDITERKKFEEELKASESKFRSTFEGRGIGKAMADMTGNVVEVNEEFCDFLGYTEEELKQLSFVDFTHPEERERDYKGFLDLVAEKINTYSVEKRYIRKDGKIVWGAITTTLIKDASGNPQFSLGQIQNITARKEMEAQIEEKNNELKDLVDKLTSHNNQLKEYNNIVSHNLRAPVSNLNALMKLLSVVEDDEKEFLTQQINSSIEKITETLDHLVEVVKLRDNKDVEFVENDLNGVYTRVKEQLLGRILESNVNISTDFEEVKTINYPALYLESIFLNMMDNAIKYQSDERPLKISINSSANGKYNIINFADNGLGIDMERHGDKMFKLHKTFHRRKDSKGFGLFMLKNQLEAMGGEISCESEVGIGTTFIIKILK